MDWADDVAYSVHDLEDGLYVGHITLPGLHDRSQQEAVTGMTATYYCPPGSADVAELGQVLDALLALPCWPERFDGGPASLAALKHLTSELIGRFCRAAQEATLAASAGTGLGRAGRAAYPLRRRPGGAPAAAARVRAAQGRRRALRDEP